MILFSMILGCLSSREREDKRRVHHMTFLALISSDS